jgi:hypothetical protein
MYTRDQFEMDSQPMRQRLAETRAKQAEASAVLAGHAERLLGVRGQLALAQANQDQMSEIYGDLVNNMKHNEQKLDAQYKGWHVKGAHVMMYKEKMEDQVRRAPPLRSLTPEQTPALCIARRPGF